jgi:transcriptional regulator with XRE-family HTH domain
MKGETLKIILMKNGIKQNEVARLIGDSQQKFNAALSSEDVKSSLIEKISAAIGLPISKLYGEEGETSTGGNTERFLSLLEEKDRQMAKCQDAERMVIEILHEKEIKR